MICEKRKRKNTFPECETEQNPHNPLSPEISIHNQTFLPASLQLRMKKKGKKKQKKYNDAKLSKPKVSVKRVSKGNLSTWANGYTYSAP